MLCDELLRAQITEALRVFPLRTLPHQPQRAAAVALVVAEEGHGADLPQLPHHESWSTQAALVLTQIGRAHV